jgi:hypothetical protein
MRFTLTDEQREEVVDAEGHQRQDLRIVSIGAGRFIIVHDSEEGLETMVLCFATNEQDFTLYHPVEWSDYSKAEEWCQSGNIKTIIDTIRIEDVAFRREIIRSNYDAPALPR